MARASIMFEDSEEGILMTLNFDSELPDDPADATEAQIQAMVAFQAWAMVTNEGEEEVTYDFDDGESEEASREV